MCTVKSCCLFKMLEKKKVTTKKKINKKRGSLNTWVTLKVRTHRMAFIANCISLELLKYILTDTHAVSYNNNQALLYILREQGHTSLKLMSMLLQVHGCDLQGIWSHDTKFIFPKPKLDIPALNLRAQLNHRSHNMSSDPTGREKGVGWGGRGREQ